MIDAVRVSTLGQCNACGALNELVSDPIVVDERDIDAMTSLLGGAFDNDRCGACGTRQASTAELRLTLSDGRMFVVPRRMDRGVSTPTPAGAIEVASADALRSVVMDAIRPRLDLINQAAHALGQDQLDEWLEEHWQQFTADTFRAALLVARFAVSGDGPFEADAVRAAHEQVGQAHHASVQIQVAVWLVLLGHLGEDASEGLEPALETYIQPASIVPGTIEAWTCAIEHKGEECRRSGVPFARTELYVMEAILASACDAVGIDNPHAHFWASEFLGFEMNLASPGVAPYLLNLRVSAERARRTITSMQVWNAVMKEITRPDFIPEQAEALDAAAARAGHHLVVGDAVSAARRLSGDAPLRVLEECVAMSLAAERPVGLVADGLKTFFDTLCGAGRMDDFDRLVAFALSHTSSPEARAGVEIAAARSFRLQHMPARALDRLTSIPVGSEFPAGRVACALLWAERAHALRALRRLREAVVWSDRAVQAAGPGYEAVPSAHLAAALVDRETGRPERSLNTLQGLRGAQEASGLLRRDVLAALASVQILLGLPAQALETCDELARSYGAMSALDTGPIRALALTLIGQQQQADLVLAGPNDEAGRNQPKVTAHQRGSASRAPLTSRRLEGREPERLVWNALAKVELTRTAFYPVKELEMVVLELQDLITEMATRSDHECELLARDVVAHAEDLLLRGAARSRWEEASNLRASLGNPPEANELIALARFAFSDGDADRATGYLRAVPSALAVTFGKIADIAKHWGAMWQVSRSIGDLETSVPNHARPSTALLLGELQRDVLGRAGMVYSHGVSGTALPVPTPTQLQPLAAKLGPFGVLEWTQIARGRLDTRLTCINEEGTSIYSLGPPPIDDIRSLSLRLRTRLNGWFRGRADPLDVPEWRTLQDWLRNELDDRPSIDHLVVIEHVVVPGLPWHAMRDTQWTVSYASSWTELFDIAQAIGATSPPASLGIVRVPRTFESPLIVDSLQEAARRLGDLARASGMTLAEAANGEADAPRVSALMGSCDVLQLLCHGFVSASEEEVALMLASEGQLPLGNSAAADTVIGRRHRFGWRELEHVERAPAYVWWLPARRAAHT
jgi:CHAT domain